MSFKNDYETISTGLRGTSRVHEQSLGFSLEARCTLFLLEIRSSVMYLEHKLFQRCCSWRGCQAVSSPFRDRAAARFMCDLSPLSSGPCGSLSLWVVSVKLLQSKPYLFSYNPGDILKRDKVVTSPFSPETVASGGRRTTCLPETDWQFPEH